MPRKDDTEANSESVPEKLCAPLLTLLAAQVLTLTLLSYPVWFFFTMIPGPTWINNVTIWSQNSGVQ